MLEMLIGYNVGLDCISWMEKGCDGTWPLTLLIVLCLIECVWVTGCVFVLCVLCGCESHVTPLRASSHIIGRTDWWRAWPTPSCVTARGDASGTVSHWSCIARNITGICVVCTLRMWSINNWCWNLLNLNVFINTVNCLRAQVRDAFGHALCLWWVGLCA